MFVTLLGITRLLKEEQPSNALFSMVVTLSEITRLLKEEQLQNALSPILVTLLDITRLLKEEQTLYLQPIITQYFIDNKSEIWLLFLIAHSKR